jgi:hypothetical protein
MSKKISLSDEYDDYVLKYVGSYTVSHLVGVGKYDKKTFQSLPKAVKYYNNIKTKNPIARIGVYAVCYPPHTILPVNKIMNV